MSDSEPQRQSPPSMADVSRAVTEFARSIYPNVTHVELTLRAGSGMESRIQVPLAGAITPLADRIIEALQNQFKPGYIKGSVLAAAVECDRDNGNFKQAIIDLKTAGRLESSHAGYRLIE